MLLRRPRSLIRLATLVVTVAFSWFALSGVHLGEAWRALRGSDYLWLVPAMLVLALAMGARALRWRSLFAPGRRPPLGAVANAMMLGYLYNNILPARSGEIARVLVLSRRSSAPPIEIAGTAALERLYDVVGVLLIFFLATPWLPAVAWLGPAAIAAGALALAIVAAALVLARYGERALRTVLSPLRRLPRVSDARLARTSAELANGLSGLRHPGVALLGLLWTLVAWMLTALLAYLVSVAFHLQLPFACGLLVSVAVGLAMILPSPPAALGVFEAAALIGLKAYGLSHSAALPYALVLHLVNFLPFILVGVALLHYNSRHPPAQAAPGSYRGPSFGGLRRYVPRFASGAALVPRRALESLGDGLGQELAAGQPEPVQLQASERAERLQAVYDGGAQADG
ncbi:MAG TPA: lysylphosphatidylglycerol synthase transmembrane domain-containing protein [Solirubrobacteraceae bacterium]|nr:lysylphosphatidylglycerol synthase transmembrane domain-containing protein [Solirubrobacteraceae bacterium]